ncbi:uncharacterized protein LOC130591452 [Beta vulgaris subsp. vulgaris]|uniref:uncharacterized protein LOC130591452 n=1 Tax=Beta vulgaris subsp. vulgaris TaxID=3555 RepID=UPI0025472C63|nr:uncharacterized protein LOC130591452 [Beta vulgaris subsp. vulgaris]
MSILSLNCRGLGNPSAVGNLRDLLRREAPSLVFLSETKLSSGEFVRIISRLGDFYGLSVDSRGRSGGLALLWKKDINVVLSFMSLHHIDVIVRRGLGEEEWRCTGFYGWPEIQNRHLSWSLLESLTAQSTLPWLCLGDFNEILLDSEKMGGNDRASWQMENFRNAVNVCGFHDVPFSGYEFTYDNGRELQDNVQCRLDRALVTTSWSNLFLDAHLWNLDREWSDHAPIKLTLWRRDSVQQLGGKPFRFEQIWASEAECEEVIAGAWLYGANLETKVEACAANLKKWSGRKFGPIFRELKKKRKKLKKLNGAQLSASQLESRRGLLREIEILSQHEERYWQQRSRALWLADGDRNTKFSTRELQRGRRRIT